MADFDSLSERLLLGVLRAVASVLALAGLSLWGPAIPLLLYGTEGSAETSARALFFSGLSLFLGGALCMLALRALRPRPSSPAGAGTLEPPAVGVWAYPIGIALAAVPLWLLLRMPSLLSLCRRLLELADRMGVAEAFRRSDPYAGIVLVPLAGVLAVPVLQLATVALLVLAGAPLTVWALARRTVFPRAFVACAALFAGLSLASLTTAELARYGERLLAPYLSAATSDGRDREFQVQAQAAVREYVGVTGDAARAIAVAGFAYVAAAAPFLASRRLRAAFAPRVPIPPA